MNIENFPDIQNIATVLKLFKRNLLQNHMSDRTKSWLEVREQHGVVLELFRFVDQDGGRGRNLEILKTATISTESYFGLGAIWRHWGYMEFQ